MKEGYKETPVGMIPEDWGVKKLGELGVTYNGLTGKTKEDFGFGMPYIPYKNIFKNSSIDPEYLDFVQVSPDENQNTCKYGDIFFTTSSETAEEVGMSSVLLKEIPETYLNSFCFGFRLTDFHTLIPDYARYLLRGDDTRKILNVLAQGYTRYNLSKTNLLERLLLKIPPLSEQSKIASILSTVDDKIDSINQRIEETRKLKQGLMQQLLTRGIGHSKFKDSPLGEIPESWEVVKIEDLLDAGRIISHLDGNHGELYPKANEFIGHGIPYIGANSFVDGRVDFSLCKRLSIERASKFKKGVAKSGDVLFAHNATVGPVAFLETKHEYVILSTTATYYRLDNKTIDSKFWLYFLCSDSFKSQYSRVMGQSTRNQVPITMQRSFISIVPTYNEQRLIGNILCAVDNKITTLQGKKTDYEQLKKGLMQQLLTGKIRVKLSRQL